MPITDEDVLRELLHRATDDTYAPSEVPAGIVARHYRRLRNTRILSITTTSIAAAAVVAAVIVTRVGPSAQDPTALPPVKLTAVQVLDQLSVAAARAPQLTDRYIAFTERDQGGDYYQRTSVFDSLTGDVWTYQHGGDVPSELPVATHASPTRAEFAAWPTNPARLRALLLSQAEQLDTIKGQTPDDLVFQQATNWLWNPLLSPALRSAMYKVLAATPGVTVKTGITDETGRPAIEISRHDSVTAEEFGTFESPTTGAVLEQDFSYLGIGVAVYTAATGYATLPANPYGGG
jgi:hypothetical protein